MKFVEGKRVAFVAQTPVISGKGLGEEIDGFDFVFRSNVFPVTNTADFGSRCDIISCTKDNFRFLRGHSVPNIITYDALKGYREDVKGRKVYYISEIARKAIREWAAAKYGVDIIDATSGLIAFFLCHIYGAIQIKMFGFSGYQDAKMNVVNHGEVEHYTSDYIDTIGTREHIHSVDMRNYDCHNFDAHNTVWRRLLIDRLVEMDNYSKQYFR